MRLTDASKQGQLTERGKPEQFQGAYSEIVRGVNAVLDAIIAPLNVSANYVDRISKGDVPSLNHRHLPRRFQPDQKQSEHADHRHE